MNAFQNITIDPEFQRLLLPLQPEEFAQLERNILEEGCREPLLVWQAEPEDFKCYRDPLDIRERWECDLQAEDGIWRCRRCDYGCAPLEATLIDGHNRYEICTKHGIEFEVWYLEFENRKEAHDWIINNQLGRRNVTREQASYLRGKRYNGEKKQGARTDLTSRQNEEKLETRERLADQYNVSPSTIERDAKFAEAVDALADNTGEEVRHAILSGKLSKQDVVNISELDRTEQKEIVARGIPEIMRIAKEHRAQKQEVRRQERLTKIAKISANSVQPLNAIGRYPLIYADPPWLYEFCSDDADNLENHYPTMSLDALCSLPVAEATTDDCILFLWCTSPKLEESLRVINAWGFSYRSCAVWDKQWIGQGYYFRQTHEFLLVAAKGALPVPAPSNRPPSIFAEKRTEHSRKPQIAYELIEKMYPEIPKLELFARTAREGWQAWGYEAGEGDPNE